MTALTDNAISGIWAHENIVFPMISLANLKSIKLNLR